VEALPFSVFPRLESYLSNVEFRGLWLGRGIYDDRTYTVSIPPDRQSAKDAKDLCRWLNNDGLRTLLQKLRLGAVRGSSDEVLFVDEGVFHLRASPNSSYGYLYMLAWEEVSERAEQPTVAVTA
jgi:hypothetical protein